MSDSPLVESGAMTRTLTRWLEEEALTFSLRDSEIFTDAVDRMMEALPSDLRLLGLGEPLHGGEEFLSLRNQLFQRLVEVHGFTAIALESGLTRGRRVDDYVRHRGEETLESVLETGFDQGLGQLEANRELVEWMRRHNERLPEDQRVGFHGFDLPTGTTRCQSPRDSLFFALDYLEKFSPPEERSRCVGWDKLLGSDGPWEDPSAFSHPERSPGDTPQARELRHELEDMISELERRRPEFWDSDRVAYLQAYQHAVVARALLNYHAALARRAGANTLLGIRDALMADNLLNILAREKGKVLTFAHNSHLQSSYAKLPRYQWWPAGSHLRRLLGDSFVAIAGALGTSLANGLERPEKETVEAALMELRSPAFLLITRPIKTLAASGLPARASSSRNPSYIPIGKESLLDFQALIFLPTVSYSRGAMPGDKISSLNEGS